MYQCSTAAAARLGLLPVVTMMSCCFTQSQARVNAIFLAETRALLTKWCDVYPQANQHAALYAMSTASTPVKISTSVLPAIRRMLTPQGATVSPTSWQYEAARPHAPSPGPVGSVGWCCGSKAATCCRHTSGSTRQRGCSTPAGVTPTCTQKGRQGATVYIQLQQVPWRVSQCSGRQTSS